MVTLALVAFQQERFVAEAIRGALSQTYHPLEVILSDDCSADRTFEVIQAEASAYSGPHKVVLNRNAHNLGLAGHLNRIAEIATGSIIALAAGDDISSADRIARLVGEFRKSSDIKAVMSGYVEIGPSGESFRSVALPQDFELFTSLKMLARNGGWVGMGATFAYDRECFHSPGLLEKEIVCEDRLLPFRAAMLGRIGFIREPLVAYRLHDASVSAGTSFKSSDYERKHQKVLAQELGWAQQTGLLTQEQFREVAKALRHYPAHFERSRRLAGSPLLHRMYSVFYARDVWQRRLSSRVRRLMRAS